MREASSESIFTRTQSSQLMNTQADIQLKKPKKSKDLILIIFRLIVSILLMWIYYIVSKDETPLEKFTIENKVQQLISYFLFSSSLFFGSSALISFVSEILSVKSTGFVFIRGVFTEFVEYFGIFIAALSTSLMIGTPNPKVPEKNTPINTEFFMFDNASGIFMSIAILFGAFLLKNFILYGINFNLYFNYYSDRIEQNNLKIGVLRMLNDIVSAGSEEETDVICSRLIQVLASDHNEITFPDLKKVLGEECALNLFRWIDNDHSNTIGVDELEDFYTGTLADQQQIALGLQQKNSSVSSLNFILTVITTPLALILSYSSLTRNDGVKAYGTLFITSIIGTSYIFTDTIKTFFGSIIFVFFVRPFEIDDYVLIDSKIYKVKEINILTTVLLDDSLHVIYPNTGLLSKAVTNLRCSKANTEHYKFEFDSHSFKSKKEELKSAINLYIKKNSSMFKKKAHISEVKVSSASNLVVSIDIGFKYENLEIKTIHQNKNNFAMHLQEILEDINLRPISVK